MDPVDGDQVYAAERLLQIRTRRGRQEYLVKWKGWSSKHNTWEPVDNILDERLIQEFDQRMTARTPVKRRAAGAPPTTAAASSSSATEQPPAKRGRRPGTTNRAKTESSSETSPSTSVATRRSSRRSSITKESRESSVNVAKQTVAELPKKAAIEDKKALSKDDEGASEKEEQAHPEKAEPAQSETEPEPSIPAEEPQAEQVEQEESDGAPSDAVAKDETAPELEVIDVPSGDDEPKQETPPLEIFVERKVEVEVIAENGTDAATGTNTSNNITATSSNETFMITNETDPNCTHKIQVFTAAVEETNTETGTSNNTTNNNASGEAGKKIEDNGNIAETTNIWTDSPPKGQTSSAFDSPPNEPYQYNGSHIITDVTANETTLTFYEI